jgi:quercetin dioxygenase-like cupin family protein
LTDREIAILNGSRGPELQIVAGAGEARAIIWPGMGARSRSLHRVWLAENAGTVELSHPSDAVYYVLEGTGWVDDPDADERHDVAAGAMFHVDAGTRYAIHAGAAGMQVVGGPAPADDALYAHLSDAGG